MLTSMQYNREAAQGLGSRLGRRLCAFLALRAHGGARQRQRRRPNQAFAVMEALGQAFLRLAEAPGQGRSSMRGHQNRRHLPQAMEMKMAYPTTWQGGMQDSRVQPRGEGYIGQLRVAFGLVYLWTGKESSHRNTQTLACMEEDLENLGIPAILLGDFNSHIEPLDKVTDSGGRLLLEWAGRTGLMIVNTTDKCDGRVTWAARDKSSCMIAAWSPLFCSPG
ncbi:hypothetical protein HPB48_000493 [Haemaphysalis longicornis]|uniref:Endonuclease/exonuclease/phosphatase domain-containing protein n=1 Tax=Haemaphysalis longicornis TaxID=44386 RepID=A0A9J6FSE2_HAELO|nr:hypothetical protein HPB48_000493 [Haemaphysalis longicornis]